VARASQACRWELNPDGRPMWAWDAHVRIAELLSRSPRAEALVSLALLLGRPLLAQCPDGSAPPCRQAPAVHAAPPAPTSVAVLPLENRSPDPADAYLAEGMTEEIGNRLTQVGRLQVKARTLVAAQWRRTPDAFETARRLNIAWFVSGNVRHAGTRLFVNVELVRATTGEEVWASRFPRPAGDVFAVQAEVAESVAAVVGGRLSPEERATLTRRPTRDNEAYRLYVLGNTLLKRRTPEDVQRAIDAYTEAVQRDSDYAAVWAALSYARDISNSWSSLHINWKTTLPRDSLLLLARSAASRALALDSSAADSWMAEAITSFREGDFGRAHTSCERALRLGSLNANLYNVCADLYGPLGLLDLAAAEPLYRRAIGLDPDFRLAWAELATVLAVEGRLAEAEALFDTTLAIAPWGPAFQGRAYTRFLRGNGTGAMADLAEAERLTGLTDSSDRSLYAIALGDSVPARAALGRLRGRAGTEPQAQSDVARFSAALGMRAEALSALERYRTLGIPPEGYSREPRCTPTATCSVNLGTWDLLHDPIFVPLRAEPRFVRLLEETRPRVPW
jgi:TolB-like protein/tetratricopeptide (TPR) repeat protein